MKKETIGVILAAGRGSRMKNLTDEKPKCFIKIKGKRLIDYQLSAFKKNNIKKIIIITGYKSEFFEEFEYCTKIKNNYWSKTSMFYSLSKANKYLMNYNCIISYSDIFYSQKAICDLLKSKNTIAISYDPNWHQLWSKRFQNPLDDAETFKIDKNSFLKEIGGKTDSLDKIKGQYMGLIKTKPSGWKKLHTIWSSLKNKNYKNNISITELFNHYISLNKKIKAIEYTEIWGEVDSKEDYRLYKT